MISKIHSKKPVVLFCLLCFLLTLMPGVVYADTATKIDYVSLGDSLAAGRTPYKTIDKSYTDYIADRLADENLLGHYKNYGVSGFTTGNILMQITDSTNTELQNDLAAAEVITLDAGANDVMNNLLDYEGNVITDPVIVNNTFFTVGLNLYLIIDYIKAINPDAKIYVMGYYNAFPHVPVESQAPMVDAISFLNWVINTACGDAATYVPTESAIAKDYDKYLPNHEDIHLSLFGYKALAKEFWSYIRIGLTD